MAICMSFLFILLSMSIVVLVELMNMFILAVSQSLFSLLFYLDQQSTMCR